MRRQPALFSYFCCCSRASKVLFEWPMKARVASQEALRNSQNAVLSSHS